MTLSSRPDDRGGLSSMEKWSNSRLGWGNHQHLNVLESSMSPLFHTSQTLQFTDPQLMDAAEHQALVQAFAQVKGDSRDASNSSLDTLLMSSNSSSMVESCTSDEDCTAPEIRMNCISSLGRGPLWPVLGNVLDRTGSTDASTLMAKEDFYRMHHPAETSLGGSLSPCGVSDDSLDGADAHATVMAGVKRRFQAGDKEWMDQMHGRKVQKGQQCETAPVFQDRYGTYAEAPLSSAGVTATYNSDLTLIIPSTIPFSQSSNVGGGSSGSVDMDSMRSILFRHPSQPSLEEIASSRPKRRNVRISKDPQSVAARHRRECISDRMRVLQRLVPGGTKMDTASMLDEAIHYVKFLKLQLQIGNDNYCDAQGNFAQPDGAGGAQLASLVRHPFDLNCAAAFQAWPVNNNKSILQASPQGRHSTQWTRDAAM